MSDDWYEDETFWRTFGPLMFSDQQFNEAEDQVRALIARLELKPGDRVLDLGSGPGRHALPLARAGLEVTALDSTAGLLAELGRRADDGQLNIERVHQDMREFRRPESFDAVLVMWTSFGYFEDEQDHLRVLEHARASLRPGGLLVLDLVGLETLCRTLEPVHLTEYDDGRLLIERPLLVDHNTRLENEWLLIDGESVRRATFSHRVWSAGEIACLLDQAGFAVEAIDADLDGTPYDLEAERMWVIARVSSG
ncbi:MAG: class I SAM-dependent methyltransferase [Wenzhouxiangellaceae bacterium]